MARGRIIDKTLYTNESLAEVSMEARYLYIGLIVFSDDDGRMKANPKYIKAVIFPFDDAIRINSISQLRDELVRAGLVTLYAAGGNEYISHPNWKKWQPIRQDRAKPSDCPSPKSEKSQIVDGMATKWQPNCNQMATGRRLYQTKPNQTKPNLNKKDIPAGLPEESANAKKPSDEPYHPSSPFQVAKMHILENWRLNGNKYPFSRQDAGILKRILGYGLPKAMGILDLFMDQPDDWVVKNIGRNLRGLNHQLAKLLDNPRLLEYENRHTPKSQKTPIFEIQGMPVAEDSQAKLVKSISDLEIIKNEEIIKNG